MLPLLLLFSAYLHEYIKIIIRGAPNIDLDQSQCPEDLLCVLRGMSEDFVV